jgi:hypothetical protein
MWKIFDQKCHYIVHINRKKSCENILLNNNSKELLKKSINNEQQMKNQVNKSNSLIHLIENNNNTCSSCDVNFTQKSSLKRHLLKGCPAVLQIMVPNKINKSDDVKKLIDNQQKMEKEITELRTIISSLQKKINNDGELIKCVKKLIVGAKNNIDNDVDNDVDNNIDNNNDTNFVNNNTKIYKKRRIPIALKNTL